MASGIFQYNKRDFVYVQAKFAIIFARYKFSSDQVSVFAVGHKKISSVIVVIKR